MKPRRNLFLGSLIVIALSQAAIAEVGTWSGPAGGTWDTSATNWTGLATVTPWDDTNGPSNTAVFNTASLAATVSGTVHTNGITFTTGGSLTGGVVTLAGTNPFIDVAASQTGTIGTTDLVGSAGLVKTGDGILSLGTAKTLTGGVSVNAGTLQFTTNGGLGSNLINLGDTTGSAVATLAWINNTTATGSNEVTVRSGSSGVKNLQVNSGVTGTISTLTLNDNVTKINDGALNVSNDTLMAAGNRTITVNAGTLSLNGPVDEDGGVANLVKAGGGTLVLANATNFYTGTTAVTGGVMQANAAGSLPGHATPGNVTINGGTLNVRVGGSGWSTTQVDDLLANATKTSGNFGIDTTNGNLTQWTLLTPTNLGTLGLVKNGSNRLTLDLANTFTGNVTLNAGTLRLTHSSALGTGPKTLASQGPSRVVELSGGITLPSNITLAMSSNSGDGAGLSSISGNNVVQGPVQITNGNPVLNISSSAGSTLTLSTVTLVTTSRPLNLGGASTNLNTITGAISENAADRIVNIVKQGVGTWVLSGNNTFKGTVAVNAGTLIAQSNTALGAATVGTPPVSVGTTVNTPTSDGGTLDLGGTVANLNLGAEVITIHGTGVGGNGALVNNGSNDQSNAVQRLVLGANATVGGIRRWDVRGTGNTFNMAGFTLTKRGSNTVSLVGTTISNPGNIDVVEGVFGLHTTVALPGSAANTLTVRSGAAVDFFNNPGSKVWTMVLEDGRVTTSNQTTSNWAGPGTLSGTVGGTFDIPSGQAFTFNGNIGESAAGRQLIKSGAGTLVLSGTNSYTGTTTVSGGTLSIDCTSNTSKLPDGAALNLAGGALNLSAGAFTEAVGSVNLTSGASSITRAGGATAVLQMNTITPSVGAVINFAADSIASTDNLNTGGILGPWATVGGNTWAVNSTNAADGLITGLASYTLSSLAGDTAANYAGANISIDSNPVLDGDSTPNSLRFNNAAANTLSLTGTNIIGSGGVLVGSSVGNFQSTIDGGSITGPADGDFVINQQNTSNTLVINSSIVNNGTATNVVKVGPGRAVLGGVNSYSGTTTIGVGALQIDDPSALGSSTAISVSGIGNSALVLGNNITAGAGKTLTIRGGGFDQFFGALSTPTTNSAAIWEGNVVIGDLLNTRIGSRAGTLEISGVISEATAGSSLTVRSETASSMVILSGNNTFAGPVTSSTTGILNIRHANALGSTVAGTTVGSGTTLQLEGGITFAAEPLNITSGGVGNLGVLRNISGDNTLTGAITLAAQSRISSAAETLTLDVASGSAITGTNQNVIFSGAGNIVVNDPIATGTGAVTKEDAGVLSLNAVNTYTGATSFQGGIVNVSSLTDYGVAGPLGARTAAQEAGSNIGLRFVGGTLQYTGSTAQSTNRQIRIGTLGGTIDASGSTPSATLSFTHSGTNTDLFETAGTRTLTLAGSNTGDNTFAIRLENQAANPTSLIKAGDGRWVLTNAHTYTGTTSVNGGNLHLVGSLAAGSAVTVGGASASGNPTLSGSGTVNGTLLIAAAGGGASGSINPGAVGGTGTLNTAATTVEGTYVCDIGASDADRLNVTGDLTLSGATLDLNELGTPTAASYTIATYSGTLTGTFAAPVLPTGYTLDYGTGTNSEIKLVLSATDYDLWAGSFTPAVGLPGADDDGDGLSNFEEYAFGLQPNSGSSVNPISQQLSKSTGLFKYTRRATPATTGVTYTYESSTTLSGAWTPFTPDSQSSNAASPVEEVTVDVPNSLLAEPKLFIRVRASKP